MSFVNIKNPENKKRYPSTTIANVTLNIAFLSTATTVNIMASMRRRCPHVMSTA